MAQGKSLVWLSFNRSGTNYLSDLLAAISSVSSMTEVFENSSVQVHSFQDSAAIVEHRLRDLSEFLDCPLPATGAPDLNALMKTPQLVDAVHAKPIATIHRLIDHNATPLSSLKLFAQHLPLNVIRDIITDDRVIPCVFLRNPLDVFVSMQKRKASGAFRGADTTTIKPRIGIKAYKEFLEKRRVFLDFIFENQARFAIKLSYDALMGLTSDSARIEYLASRLGALAPVTDQRRRIRTSPIQDRNTRPEDKIANFRNFSKQCETAGITPGEDLCPWIGLDEVN